MDFKKRQEFDKRTLEIRMAIHESIDEICKKYDYQVSYLEINTALVDILKSNNSYELRELLKEEGDED